MICMFEVKKDENFDRNIFPLLLLKNDFGVAHH